MRAWIPVRVKPSSLAPTLFCAIFLRMSAPDKRSLMMNGVVIGEFLCTQKIGSGTGTFSALGAGVVGTTATQITGLVAADVDGNGVTDLVILEAADLSVLFGEK